MAEPKTGEVYYRPHRPGTTDWERITFADSDMIETEDFRGGDHIYRTNYWHELGFVQITIPNSVTVPVKVEYSDEFKATCIVGIGCLAQGNPFGLKSDEPRDASVALT